MLKFSSDANLLDKKVSKECLPFYQLWSELFFEKTLDIYQYKLFNTLQGLNELNDVISVIIDDPNISNAHITACREELYDLVVGDRILSAYYLPLQNRLRETLLNKKISSKMLRAQITNAITILEPNYKMHALKDLKESILAEDISAIIDYTNIIASQVIHEKWSAQGLRDLLRFFESDAPFEKQWSQFITTLSPQKIAAHDVFIHLSFKPTTPDIFQKLDTLGLNIYNANDILDEYSSIPNLHERVRASARYFFVKVEANDVYAAAHFALSQISEQLNFASFYNMIPAWNISDVTLIAINSETKYFQTFPAEKLYKTHNYIESSGQIFENTRQIFSKSDNNIVRDKLQGVFSYSNISKASLFQEEKFMNLWVALESLARTNLYGNIISDIRETVPPAMSLRYIYHIIRNFVEDCKRCRIQLAFSTKTIDPNSADKRVLVEDMLYVFYNDDLFQELEKHCSVHTLLQYRAKEIHATVSNILATKEAIQAHYKTVRWQLQRLYRIRNEIAHSALRDQSSLIIYIEHLDDYLTSYITEIVTCLSEKNINSIESAQCLIKDNYEVFIESIQNKNSKDHPMLHQFIKTGIIDLLTD